MTVAFSVVSFKFRYISKLPLIKQATTPTHFSIAFASVSSNRFDPISERMRRVHDTPYKVHYFSRISGCYYFKDTVHYSGATNFNTGG